MSIYSLNAGAHDYTAIALDECGEFSQAEMRDCLAKKVRASAKALTSAETKAVLALGRWDEDEQFVRKASEKLQLSKTAFLNYREEHCRFASSLGGGAIPNALELRRLACVYALNMERVSQLTKLVTGLPHR